MPYLSESLREREAFKYEPDALRDSRRHRLSNPIPSHSLRGSRDGALTAFAQLATFKLNAQRAWISIFDRDFQYIVAEATPSLSLDFSDEGPDHVRLCGTALPRSEGICEHVLDMDMDRRGGTTEQDHKAQTSLPVAVIPDLTQDPRIQARAWMNWNPNQRFYAGVPIRSPQGIDIGVLGVSDNEPRSSLDEVSVKAMRDLSRIIMGHLEARRFGDAARRNIRMIRGLSSFVEGYGSMWGWLDFNASAFSAKEGAEGELNSHQQLLQRTSQDEEVGASAQLEGAQSRPETTATTTDDDQHQDHATTAVSNRASSPSQDISSTSVESSPSSDPGEDHFLTQAKQVFSKAANIVRESIEVEGVLFLDASVRSFASLKPNAARSRPSSGAADSPPSTPSSGDDNPFQTPDSPEGDCNVFGYSTSALSSIDRGSLERYRINFPERLLKTLIRRYQSGKIFNFDQDGSLVAEESSESGSGEEEESSQKAAKMTTNLYAEPNPRGSHTKMRHHDDQESRINAGQSIIHIIPGARSAAVIPLWDSQKERWFAFGLVWTQQPNRTFTKDGEMSFLRAFGTIIMAEVSRISTQLSEKAKTDVLGSISHEFRSPLHGIVAAAELLRDTQLDALQKDILHTSECCGRTLLDVIDHLLDYAKINRFRLSPKKLQNRKLTDRRESFEGSLLCKAVNVDLAALTEETLESVYAGHNFQRRSMQSYRSDNTSSHSESNAMRRLDGIDASESLENYSEDTSQDLHSNLGGVSVYLDADANVNWRCCAQPGALRRIIMNLFGNSLKYTRKGVIYITLRLERKLNHDSTLHLTVTDSGIGIGQDFLRHKLFTPFAQEDQLALGTGLGLSVVHQIVRMLEGTILIESKVNVGTSVKVSLPIFAPKGSTGRDEEFAQHVSALSGLRVDVSGVDASLKITDKVPSPMHLNNISERALVENICREWLHMEIVGPGRSDIKADLVICSDFAPGESVSEVSIDDTLPPTLVICLTAVSAYEQASSFKPTPRIPIAEFVSRPTGPRKIARALIAAFNRHIHLKQSQVPSSLSEARAISGSSTLILQPTLSSEPIDVTETNFVKGKNQHVALAYQSPIIGKYFLSSGGDGEQKRGDALSSATNMEKKYLIVDDNEINLKILAALLSKLHRPYMTAHNGLEALNAFSVEPRQYCCILMDISMPVMDGLESTRQIRQLEHRLSLNPVPIFALTGLSSAETQKEAFASGIDIFLTKPVKFTDLTRYMAQIGLG